MESQEYIDGLVSVIIPLFNAEKYSEKTLNSVLEQTYNNYEVIIVDDCSTDDSPIIVKRHCDKDCRIKYYKQDHNRGAAEARNRALREASGRYIAFLDSDDLWAKEKLEKQIKQMSQRDVSFSFTAYDMIDVNDEIIKGKINIKKNVEYKDLMTKTMISTPTVIIDRDKLGDKRLPLRRTGQDYAFWLLLLRETDAFGIDEPLVHVRRRPGSLSKNKFQNLCDVWEVQTIHEGISKKSAAYHLLLYCLYTFKKRFL